MYNAASKVQFIDLYRYVLHDDDFMGIFLEIIDLIFFILYTF